MDFPEALRYSKEHEWLAVDGSRARVGITDYAQDALGDVVFVQLPEIGATVGAAAPVAEEESTKSVSDIYAPVSGTIVEVNTAHKSPWKGYCRLDRSAPATATTAGYCSSTRRR